MIVDEAGPEAPGAGRVIGVERWIPLPHGNAFARVVLDHERPGVRVAARLSAVADVAPLTARIRRWFDLDADAAAIDLALGADDLLGPLVRRTPGIRIPGSVDARETLMRTIVGQQISLAAARTVLGRLAADVHELGDTSPLSSPDGLLPFPTADEIARHGPAVLRGPERRVRTIVATAEALASGELELDVGLSTSELRDRLLGMPGIGPWTADYVALRVLGSPDLLLDSDLVLLRTLNSMGVASTARGAAALGDRWAPWRSYATLHLWRAAPPAQRRAPAGRP
jgi:AraC family transcriptional regulator of adaptative response / DNA-3-methyladenine glycosylase II